MKTFQLTGDFIELSKLLKASDLCETGGIAKTVITEGQVKVDGIVEYRKGRKLRKGQQVEYNDHIIKIIQADQQ